MAPISIPQIPACDITGQEDWPQIVQLAFDTLCDSDLAMYAHLPDEFEPMNIFIARNPQRALQWICKRVNRPRLLQVIQYIYDHPDTAVDDPAINDPDTRNDVVDEGETLQQSNRETSQTGTKRKRTPKEKGTRSANKALVEKMNLALVQTVASTQDWEDVRAPDSLSVDEQKYRNYAKRLPGVGVNAVTQMITKAVAVGTMEVFKDWQAIITVWKRQNAYGKKLFQGVATSRGGQLIEESLSPSATPLSGQIVTTQLAQTGPDEAGLTSRETEIFRLKYFEAQKTQVDGIADDMRHRWRMDELYEEYERLEREIRRRKEGTGARGRRYETVAKEHLFASVYRVDLGRRPTKEADPDLWVAFGQYLDWGKRWNMVKRRFGSVGIFGLLPRSVIANAFVEKTLNQTRLAQWIDMIAECNSDVSTMALRMEPLFLACMEESKPPSEFSFLEHLDEFRGARPLSLFDVNAPTVENSPVEDVVEDSQDGDRDSGSDLSRYE